MTSHRSVALQLPPPGGGPDGPLLPVGIHREGATTTLVVKATYRLIGSGATRSLSLAPIQRPLALDGDSADLVAPKGSDVASGSSVVVPAADGRFVVELPAQGPRLFRAAPSAEEAGPAWVLVELPLRRDDARVDPATALAEIVWRGVVVDAAALGLLVVAVEDDRAADRLVDELARARPHVVVEAATPDPTLDDAALAEARAALWEVPAPAPRTTIAAYARVAAELAERREPAAQTLARHGLDEERWMLEERAWLEAIAAAAERGDATLAGELGEHFTAAQRQLAAPAEAERTLADYADIRAALERSADPMLLLGARGMSLPAWIRLDARWSEAADADPRVADELERRLAEARERLGPVADDEGEPADAQADLADDETETLS